MLSIAITTPEQYLERVTESVDRTALLQDRHALMAHMGRLGKTGGSQVGAGWTTARIVEAVDRIDAALAAQEDLPSEAGQAGAHDHRIGEDGIVHAGGRHAHAFLWDGMIVMTDRDGEHTHPEGEPGWAGDENGHLHFGTLPDGRTIQFGPPTKGHRHEKMAGRTSYSGTHQHIGRVGTLEVPTLTEQEFLNLFSTVEEVVLTGSVSEAVGVGRIPTGKLGFQEWWNQGRGSDAVRDFFAQWLADPMMLSERASEAVLTYLDRYVEVVHEGRAMEASGDRRWRVIGLKAGVSKNGNFWDADRMPDLVRTLEGAPMQAIKFDARGLSYGHSPYHPAKIPAGLVLNSVGQLVEVAWDPTVETEESRPTEQQAKAIAQEMGWSVEDVYRKSKGAIVGVSALDGDTYGTQVHEKFQSAAERGTLQQYLGLSIDFESAPCRRVLVPGQRRPIYVREAVDGKATVLIDYVTRPSAGGMLLEAA